MRGNDLKRTLTKSIQVRERLKLMSSYIDSYFCFHCIFIQNYNFFRWTEITQLRFPRCFSCMFTMSDQLYLIGGAGKIDDKQKTTTSCADIDIWDYKTMEWKHHTDMAIPRHGHSVAYLGTQILIIGGVTTVYMRSLSNAECYCTERGIVIVKFKYIFF
jgi:Kelch motif